MPAGAEPPVRAAGSDVSRCATRASDPGADERRPPEAAGARPATTEAVLTAAIVAAKAATIAFAIDAFVNADLPRLRGKAIRTRAIGYVGALCIVPLAWRLLPGRDRYPRGLDLAVTVPLLLDAGGNAFGLYDEAHVDDVVHLTNSAIVSAVAGALFAPHVDERWQAALAGAGVSIAGETAWEILEYTAMRLGATGMGLTYEDTMDDLIEGVVGAALGALFTLGRTPRDRDSRRRRGWQGPLGLRSRRPA